MQLSAGLLLSSEQKARDTWKGFFISPHKLCLFLRKLACRTALRGLRREVTMGLPMRLGWEISI